MGSQRKFIELGTDQKLSVAGGLKKEKLPLFNQMDIPWTAFLASFLKMSLKKWRKYQLTGLPPMCGFWN